MIAAQFTDPENARIIFFAAGGLLVIAIGLVVATILWWRSSGIEPTALAPLEVMSTRSWWDSDEETRREQVQAARKLADLRAGPPEAGQIVERAGTLSGVSLVKSGGAGSAGSAGPAEFVDDDVLDDHDDDHDDDDAVDEPAAPARRGYRRAAKREPELAALDRLAQLDAAPATVSAPASTPSSALAGDAGLFDQFADDPFAAESPAESQPPPRGRRAAQRASQAAKTPQEAEADLWGGPAEPRRPIDPLLNDGLLNDGDFW